jgi:glutaredoxin 3
MPGDRNLVTNTPLTDDGAAIQDALEDITKQRSVPNIFIGQKHIGGNSELQAKKSQLNKLLKDANAI